MNLKKLITVILCVSIVASMFSFSVHAASNVKSGTCGATTVWELDLDTGLLVISGDGYVFNSENSNGLYVGPWFNYSTYIKSVIIENGVRNIDTYLFKNCINIVEVSIPDSVVNICASAFKDCSLLDVITVSSGNDVYYEENNCVIRKSDKTLILGCNSSVIPSDVTAIGDYAFAGLNLLSEITIPNGVTVIGEAAFDNCRGIKEIILPDSLTHIKAKAFQDCRSLVNIYLPDSLLYIGPSAFYLCESIKSINFPKNVEYFNSSAFLNLDDVLMNVYYDSFAHRCFKDLHFRYSLIDSGTGPDVGEYGKNISWDFNSESGVLNISGYGSIDTTSDKAPWNEYIDEIYTIVIDEGITSIGASSFEDCTSVTDIIISDSVTYIGNSAFESCSSLTNIKLPNRLVGISTGTFRYCESIKKINIPDSVKYINNQVFFQCVSLEEINIPNNVYQIGNFAFGNCKSLKSIALPYSVLNLYAGTFSNCSDDFEAKVYEDSVAHCILSDEHIPTEVIGSTPSEFIHNNLRFVYGQYSDNINWTLNRNTGLLIISGEGDMANIGLYKKLPWLDFSNNITEAHVDDGVTSMCSSILVGCRWLRKVNINESITEIPNNAFAGCTSLEEINLHNNLTNISEGAFSGCSSLENINIPNSVTSIGESAFSDCSSIKKITIPDSVTSIGGFVFSYCTSLEEVNWTDSLKEIPLCTFNGCTSLETVVICEGTESILWRSFAECPALTSVTLPKSVTNIMPETFANSPNVILRVYKDSFGHQYAIANNIPYVLIDGEEFIRGDVNGDGIVNIQDYYRLKAILIEYEYIAGAADINDDGRINTLDLFLLKQILRGV